MSAADIDFLCQLWAATLAKYDDSPPYANHKNLYETIDATLIGGVPWQSATFQYDGPRWWARYVPDPWNVYQNVRKITQKRINRLQAQYLTKRALSSCLARSDRSMYALRRRNPLSRVLISPPRKSLSLYASIQQSIAHYSTSSCVWYSLLSFRLVKTHSTLGKRHGNASRPQAVRSRLLRIVRFLICGVVASSLDQVKSLPNSVLDIKWIISLILLLLCG